MSIIVISNPNQKYNYSLNYGRINQVTIFGFRYADQVSVGDEVLAQGNEEFTSEKILNVSTFPLQGNQNCCLIIIRLVFQIKVLIIYANFIIWKIDFMFNK